MTLIKKGDFIVISADRAVTITEEVHGKRRNRVIDYNKLLVSRKGRCIVGVIGTYGQDFAILNIIKECLYKNNRIKNKLRYLQKQICPELKEEQTFLFLIEKSKVYEIIFSKDNYTINKIKKENCILIEGIHKDEVSKYIDYEEVFSMTEEQAKERSIEIIKMAREIDKKKNTDNFPYTSSISDLIDTLTLNKVKELKAFKDYNGRKINMHNIESYYN